MNSSICWTSTAFKLKWDAIYKSDPPLCYYTRPLWFLTFLSKWHCFACANGVHFNDVINTMKLVSTAFSVHWMTSDCYLPVSTAVSSNVLLLNSLVFNYLTASVPVHWPQMCHGQLEKSSGTWKVELFYLVDTVILDVIMLFARYL